jgi:hypothetical protein
MGDGAGNAGPKDEEAGTMYTHAEAFGTALEARRRYLELRLALSEPGSEISVFSLLVGGIQPTVVVVADEPLPLDLPGHAGRCVVLPWDIQEELARRHARHRVEGASERHYEPGEPVS